MKLIAQEPKRLDAIVASQLNLSRSFVSALIDQGKVSVEGKVIFKSATKVNSGAEIQVEFNPEQLKEIPEIDLPIIYEDEDCLVINKPIGVLTHSKGEFNPEATVSSFIRNFTTGMDDNRGGIVHRLDRVTSGVLICAKNPKSHAWLQKQFSQRKTKKVYNAVINGTLDPSEAVIEMPIERNPKHPQIFRVGPDGKQATTTYKIIKTGIKYSLVELMPKTGRTHQLRVHLAQLGHPIVGDTLYGGEAADRTFLHALSLEITLPSRERKTFTAELPPEFNDIVG